MSQKRMFDRAIIDTDRFMDLGMTSKALYFLLGMEADDEGFVSYKKVMRVHGGNEDDLKVLIAKDFLIQFPTGVVVITDWNKNNYLQESRIKPTEYQIEKKTLILTQDKKYELNKCLTSIEEKSIEEKSIYNKIDFEKFWSIYPKKVGKKKCIDLWKKLSLETQKIIIEDIPKRKLDKKWIGGFIKDPERYLKHEQWNDEIIEEKVQLSGGTVDLIK